MLCPLQHLRCAKSVAGAAKVEDIVDFNAEIPRENFFPIVEKMASLQKTANVQNRETRARPDQRRDGRGQTR